MVRRIYDETILKYIPLFESLTGAKVKDCIVDDKVMFIVEKGNMGLAIGKGGANLKRVEIALKKTVKLLEFDENPIQFIRNVIYPINQVEISQQDRLFTIKGRDTKTRAMLIGRERSNIKKTTEIVKRFFDIDDIIVV